jgi:hypothetical protein
MSTRYSLLGNRSILCPRWNADYPHYLHRVHNERTIDEV